MSNVTGVVAPLEKIDAQLRKWGVRKNVLVAVDAAQSAAHMPSRLDRWPVDALTFSGHKMYGPMGIGGLVVSERLAQEIAPVLYGGGMIAEVRTQETSFHEDFAERFTAGTPDVASLVGLQAAIEFLEEIGWSELQAHEHDLVQYAYEQLQQVPQVRLIGPEPGAEFASRVGSVTWTYEGVHAHDVAQILDRSGVAVRSGHHCTMPLHTEQDWVATTRASFAVYNTREDIDQLIAALEQVQTIFGV
ncbi:aminotransferase class V-fold PLP-dependent enzyme [Candidatus Woesebacteria bacterium]|nr:aminotransferase class V-fold PLP-dependent enzyme [Candidatus Woesebacteria bacterium]